MPTAAEIVRSFRDQKGWTQEELALEAGCDVRTVQRAERGQRLSAVKRQDLAAALGVPVVLLHVEQRPADPFSDAPKESAAVRTEILTACSNADTGDTLTWWKHDNEETFQLLFSAAVWLDRHGLIESRQGADSTWIEAVITPDGRDFVEAHRLDQG